MDETIPRDFGGPGEVVRMMCDEHLPFCVPVTATPSSIFASAFTTARN